MKQLQGQLEVPRHSSSCGDFNLQAMMHIESSWINWIQYRFLPLANLGESKVKLYKMGEFCCNIVANFVKGSAAKWRFQRFARWFSRGDDPSWSKLTGLSASVSTGLEPPASPKRPLNFVLRMFGKWGKESPESLTNKLQIDQRTKARYAPCNWK